LFSSALMAGLLEIQVRLNMRSEWLMGDHGTHLRGCILVQGTTARMQMTDIVDSRTRSRMMAGIRATNTKPELALRRALHGLGLRYRLHGKGLPGKPDLVFARFRAVIFVHGCFWHRHKECRYASTPSTRADFWAAKFAANVVRDAAVASALREQGWRVGTVWECALRTEISAANTAKAVASWLELLRGDLEI